MGERGGKEEGAEDDDDEIEGATVNVRLFDDISGSSDLFWLFVEGEIKHFICAPVLDLTLLFSDW